MDVVEAPGGPHGHLRARAAGIATLNWPHLGQPNITPDKTFTYDALYRLTKATGRENDGQTQSTAFYAGYSWHTMGAVPTATGGPVLRRYTQSYAYDAVGNLTEMTHQSGDPGGAVLWRRGYALHAANNQLLSTSLPGDDPDEPSTHSASYGHNARGALTFVPHLKPGVTANLVRDFRDQLRRADLNSGGDVAWYSYDAGGERVRKVILKGAVREERLYLGATRSGERRWAVCSPTSARRCM